MAQQACEVAASLSARDNEAAASGENENLRHAPSQSSPFPRQGKRFLNGRNPALPLCYTTGKSGQNCRPRMMNGIHTPFILDERGRKLTHSYTKGKKKGRLPLKEKAPLKQLGMPYSWPPKNRSAWATMSSPAFSSWRFSTLEQYWPSPSISTVTVAPS